MLAVIVKSLVDTVDSPLLSNGDRARAEEATHYLGERLAAIQQMAEGVLNVGKVTQVNYYPQEGQRAGPARVLLFDLAKSFGRRGALTKLMELDQEVRPYLAALMVAAMAKVGKPLMVPNSLYLDQKTDAEF